MPTGQRSNTSRTPSKGLQGSRLAVWSAMASLYTLWGVGEPFKCSRRCCPWRVAGHGSGTGMNHFRRRPPAKLAPLVPAASAAATSSAVSRAACRLLPLNICMVSSTGRFWLTESAVVQVNPHQLCLLLCQITFSSIAFLLGKGLRESRPCCLPMIFHTSPWLMVAGLHDCC